MRRGYISGVYLAALGAALADANRVRPLADLPNTEGFRFTGHRKDGAKVQCVVRREPNNGVHYAARADDGHRVFASLTGWSPAEF